MRPGFLGLPWLLWAGLALVVAVIFTLVWPSDRVAVAGGWRFFLLRWAHALVWVLLAVSFAFRGFGIKGAADGAGLLALLTYLAFMAAFVTGQKAS